MKMKEIINAPAHHVGYDNMESIFSSIFGLKIKALTVIAFSIGSIWGFIENWIWDDPMAFLFLFVLVGIDLITGVIKGIKTKSFQSKYLTRTAGKLFTYTIILFVAYNVNKNVQYIFAWFPTGMISIFYATETWSIIENLSVLGFLNKGIIKFLKEKLDVNNFLNKKQDSNEANPDVDDKNTKPE